MNDNFLAEQLKEGTLYFDDEGRMTVPFVLLDYWAGNFIIKSYPALPKLLDVRNATASGFFEEFVPR